MSLFEFIVAALGLLVLLFTLALILLIWADEITARRRDK